MPTSPSPFAAWLEIQRQLQVEAFNRDPALLEGDERANFMIWNAFALEDELHEAFQEVMWKPWLTVDRGDINREAFIEELVDAFRLTAPQIAEAIAGRLTGA